MDQILGGFLKKYSCETSFLDNIHILHIRDLETQLHLIRYQLSLYASRYHIKLIIFDTIAPNFRGEEEGGSNDIIQRSQYIFETGEILKSLCYKNDIAVVLLNEVTANFSNPLYIANSIYSKYVLSDDAESNVTPALGHSLSVIVNRRIWFEKRLGERYMHTIFSPNTNQSCRFIIEQDGIRGS